VRPTILIVDDDPVLRRALARELRQYEVLEAEGIDQALTRLIENREICAVVADQHLGDGLGSDLLSEVKRRAPWSVRVLMSGALPPEQDDLDGVLAKPWPFAQALVVLRNALSTPIRA